MAFSSVDPAWKLFDLAIGAIQAFIFALLTILYFDRAMSVNHQAAPAEREGTGKHLALDDEMTASQASEGDPEDAAA